MKKEKLSRLGIEFQIPDNSSFSDEGYVKNINDWEHKLEKRYYSKHTIDTTLLHYSPMFEPYHELFERLSISEVAGGICYFNNESKGKDIYIAYRRLFSSIRNSFIQSWLETKTLIEFNSLICLEEKLKENGIDVTDFDKVPEDEILEIGGIYGLRKRLKSKIPFYDIIDRSFFCPLDEEEEKYIRGSVWLDKRDSKLGCRPHYHIC